MHYRQRTAQMCQTVVMLQMFIQLIHMITVAMVDTTGTTTTRTLPQMMVTLQWILVILFFKQFNSAKVVLHFKI